MFTINLPLVGLILLFSILSCSEDESSDPPEFINNLEKSHFDFSKKRIIVNAGTQGKQYALGTSIFVNGEYWIVAARMEIHNDWEHKDLVLIKTTDWESFSEPELIQENIGGISTGSPSLVKINEDLIYLFFIAKESVRNINIYYKYTRNQGQTWSQPKLINELNTGYYVLNNDRVKYIDGRLWIPVADNFYNRGRGNGLVCYYSDDLGNSWNKTPKVRAGYSLMEPGIVSFTDGHLLMNIRTDEDYMDIAESYDNGENWLHSISGMQSPRAPQTLINYMDTDTLYAVHNSTITYRNDELNRSPLLLSMSTDKGYSWEPIFSIEVKSDQYNFSYPSILEHDGSLYITYYKRENKNTLNTELRCVVFEPKVEN